MVVSMFGMTVMADEVPAEGVQAESSAAQVQKPDEITLSATIVNSDKDYTFAPVGTVTYTVEASELNEGYGSVVEPGPEGGLLGTTVEFDGSATLVKNAKLTTDINKFTRPGVYGYKVTQTPEFKSGVTAKTGANGYDVLVYVENNNGVKSISYVVRASGTNAEEKSNLEFTYEYQTYSVTIVKSVTGNQGETNVNFGFTYGIVGNNNSEKYIVTKTNKENVSTIVNGGTFELQDGEKVVIRGLNKDNVTVTETSQGRGYKTSITDEKQTAEQMAALQDADASNTATINEVGADATKYVNNYRATTAPTGLVMNYIPYILMAAIAGAFAFVMLRRKNREDEI